MPLILLTMSVAPERRAPVEPAEIIASALPSFKSLRATVMEESDFSRVTVAGSSSISTTSEAFAISTPDGRSLYPSSLIDLKISSPFPTRTIFAPNSSCASSAPFTISRGALSPPIASITIFNGIHPFPRYIFCASSSIILSDLSLIAAFLFLLPLTL